MPGVVKEYADIHEQTERAFEVSSREAERLDQSWFDRPAFDENLAIAKMNWPSLPLAEQLQDAVRRSLGEIRENREIQDQGSIGRETEIENTPVIPLSEDAMYEARAVAIDLKTAERDRMASTLGGFESGKIANSEMPPDAGQYYGRLHTINAEIAELLIPQRQYEQAQYNQAMGEVQGFAAGEQRQVLGSRNPETLSGLQAIAHDERREIPLRAASVLDASISPWLSNDDYVAAYQKGANSELHKWYWEQKREHGFGNSADSAGERFKREWLKDKSNVEAVMRLVGARSASKMMEEKMPEIGDGESLWSRVKNVWHNDMVYVDVAAAHTHYAVQDVSTKYETEVGRLKGDIVGLEGQLDNMNERQIDLVNEISEVYVDRLDPEKAVPVSVVADILSRQQEDIREKSEVCVPNVEIGAATSYLRGHAESGNAIIRELSDRYPVIAKDLPSEMNINSIEVRSAVPERRHERAISI